MGEKKEHMDKTIDILRKIKSQHKDSEIIVFGSRAWGTPRNDSDLDIAIVPRDINDYFDIVDDIEGSNIIYSFDILNLSSLDNEGLKERILKDGTKI